MRSPLTVLWMLVLLTQSALWWRAVAWYPSIPNRFPTKFGLDGSAVSWATKSVSSWFMLPAIGTVLVLGILLLTFAVLPRLARNAPGLLNLPHKQRFLALDPSRRVAALTPLSYFLAFDALIISALLIWALETLARGELQGPALLWPGVVLALIVIAAAIMAWTMHRKLGSLAAEQA